MNKTLNDFHSSRWLQCFPTQENLTTKTLNHKVPSFVLSSFSLKATPLKSTKKHLNNTQTLSKSCHDWQNRVTIDQIVTRLVRTTQGTTNLILKTCPASRKLCHVFPKSCCNSPIFRYFVFNYFMCVYLCLYVIIYSWLYFLGFSD